MSHRRNLNTEESTELEALRRMRLEGRFKRIDLKDRSRDSRRLLHQVKRLIHLENKEGTNPWRKKNQKISPLPSVGIVPPSSDTAKSGITNGTAKVANTPELADRFGTSSLHGWPVKSQERHADA